MRKLPLVTIDGETARDFDDAVYCEPRGKGFRLIVAIADVSHYVAHGDALDREALNRGNSVYFPRRVIPMLPEVLSNGLCSLNPQVDRLCMVCDMNIDAHGDIADYRFYPSVMWSHARFTYTAVAEILAGPAGRGGAATSRTGAASDPSVPAVSRAGEIAREARRHRFRDHRNADDVRRARQDRAHRAGGAQRRSPHHRGMHAGGQRVRVRYSAPSTSSRRCTACTRDRPRKDCSGCANFSRDSASNWAAVKRRARTITPRCSSASRAVPTPSYCKRRCCVRCARPCTARTTSGISGSRTRLTPISLRRSGVIPIC